MTDGTPEAFVPPFREFVRLAPFGSHEEPTDWHRNEGIGVNSDGNTRQGVVLQRADASAEWLVVIVESADAGWTFSDIRHFEAMKDITNGGAAVDAVEALAIADTQEGLDDA